MEANSKYEFINTELAMENKIMMENTKKQSDKIKSLNERISFLEKENAKLRGDLDQITYSRSYKILQKIKKVVKRG